MCIQAVLSGHVGLKKKKEHTKEGGSGSWDRGGTRGREWGVVAMIKTHYMFMKFSDYKISPHLMKTIILCIKKLEAR